MDNIALIGLGPHSKRIYLNYFQKHNSNFNVLIELKSKEKETKIYLEEHGFLNIKIYTIPDEIKDYELLPKSEEKKLYDYLMENNVKYLISSTEPKAHNMYLNFALRHDINILSDKPVTVLKGMEEYENVEKLKNQFNELVNTYKESKANCKIMCQRQYHRGYDYIKQLLKDIVTRYQVPITYIDIYHCDGNWEMAHDMNKENHPYKYGYGKLFHSGYHFIDLLSEFLKINDNLPTSKKITQGNVYSNYFTPNDELAVFNLEDYMRIFKNQEIPEFYNNPIQGFDKYGEKNYYGLLSFKNKDNKTITTANLNLLHYGVSRRGWIKSRDYYKKNGRIRHERINIQVGTLMCIQVHSYQSKEISDRTNHETESLPGGLEQFDIEIFRNVDIIGGKPFELIQLKDLYTEEEKENMLGYNEYAREEFISNFLNNTSLKGDLLDQKLGIEILYCAAKGLCNYYNNKEEILNLTI